MPIPYSTERVVDMILRSLRASGVIADDISAQSIRDVPNNATDAELDALAATLNYGGVSGTDVIFAIEDFDIVIDSDDTGGGFAYNQQFRVSRGANLLPITDPDDHIMSVGLYGFDIALPSLKGPLLTLGPTAPLAAGDDRIAGIDMGWDDLSGFAMCRMYAAPTAVYPSDHGTRFTSSRGLELSANPDIMFTGKAFRQVRGGFPDLVNEARFALGNYKNSAESWFFQVEEDTAGKYQLTIRPDDLVLRKMFVRGGNDAVRNPIHFVVGGKMDTTWGDPSYYENPACLIVSSAAADFPALVAHTQPDPWLSGGKSCFIFSTAHTNPTPFHYIFRIVRAGIGVFNIDSNGNANLGVGSSYQAIGADVAEWLPSQETHPVGTVLVIDSEGSLVPSSSVGDPTVAGVVSDSPAVRMGVDCEDGHGGVKPEGKALVAAIGRVTVRCTADEGPIRPGDRLVSGLNGCAVLAPDDAPSAAILGKSIGTYEGTGEGTVEALVSW